MLEKGQFKEYIYDEAIRNDKACQVVRHMRLAELAEDGSHLKIFVSAAMETSNDTLFHPKRLFQSIVENVLPAAFFHAVRRKKPRYVF